MIKLYYDFKCDIMCIVEEDGSLWKFIGPDNIFAGEYPPNKWYRAVWPPTMFDDFELIGKL